MIEYTYLKEFLKKAFSDTALWDHKTAIELTRIVHQATTPAPNYYNNR